MTQLGDVGATILCDTLRESKVATTHEGSGVRPESKIRPVLMVPRLWRLLRMAGVVSSEGGDDEHGGKASTYIRIKYLRHCNCNC